MAILLYNNGLIEDFKPKNLVFTEEEINNIFSDYERTQSKRFIEVPNVWCIWGDNDNIIEENFNRLASETIEKDIFSPLLFIHDTEINPDWGIINLPILKNYENFRKSVYVMLDKTAEEILKESNETARESGQNSMVFLNTIGPTDDKRVLFEFDPHLQNENFYKPLFFNKFADRVYTFVKKFYKKNKPFLVYADNKIIIMVNENNVEFLLNSLNDSFQKREEYETCSEIKKIKDYWADKTTEPKKRGRPVGTNKNNKKAEK